MREEALLRMARRQTWTEKGQVLSIGRARLTCPARTGSILLLWS